MVVFSHMTLEQYSNNHLSKCKIITKVQIRTGFWYLERIRWGGGVGFHSGNVLFKKQLLS